MNFDDLGMLRSVVDEACADLEAHNQALIQTVFEEMLNGTDPNDAVSLVALRCGEEETYLRRLTIRALREALDRN